MTTEPRAVTAETLAAESPLDYETIRSAVLVLQHAGLRVVRSAPHPDPEPRDATATCGGCVGHVGPVHNQGDCIRCTCDWQMGADPEPREALRAIADRLVGAVLSFQTGHQVEAIAQEYRRAALRVEPSSIDVPRCDYGCDACRDFEAEADAEDRLTQEAIRAERTRE